VTVCSISDLKNGAPPRVLAWGSKLAPLLLVVRA
jgi:hypothetical protein